MKEPEGRISTIYIAISMSQSSRHCELAVLPVPHIRSKIDTVKRVKLSMLQADLNVSLTAINLLWNAADLLAKRSVHSLSTATGDPLPNGTSPALLDKDNFEELLRFLFQAIQVIPCLLGNRVGEDKA